MTFDLEKKIMRCGQAVIKESPKEYSKDMNLGSI